VIYRGPITTDQLIRDLGLLDDEPETLRNHAVPVAGRWHAKPFDVDLKRHATAFLRGGFVDQGAKYLEMYLQAHLNKKGWGPPELWPSPKRLAELCDVLANFYRLQNEPKKVVGVYQIALKFDPEFVPSMMNLGKIMIGQRKFSEGLRLLEQANRLSPADPIVASDLAIAYAMTGRPTQAEEVFLGLLKLDAESSGTRLNLGRLYFQTGRFTESVMQLNEYLTSDPNSEEALTLLCRILTSSPNDGDRDPQKAKRYVARLQSSTQMETAETIDLLAAIHAELGEFENAISEARRAIRHCNQQGNASLAKEIQRRLQLYLNGSPYRLR
jgi:tetratricopeptide (TPR) repeat protein